MIIESTEISGTPVFEEVVDLDALANMVDPVKKQLVELVRSHGEDLLPGDS